MIYYYTTIHLQLLCRLKPIEIFHVISSTDIDMRIQAQSHNEEQRNVENAKRVN